MHIILAIGLVLLIALIMSFLVKKIPILGTVASLVLAVYLIGVLFSLGGVTQISDFVNMIPYLQWVIAVPAGVLIGTAIGKYLPF